MNEPQTGDRSWIDEVATRFDRAWKTGQRPRIEEYLADVAEPVRTQLLEELLRVELEIRRTAGEQPIPEEYRRRFPGHAVAINFATEAKLHNSVKGESPMYVRLKPGDHVGKYELIEWLGGGGQGEVWKARYSQNENDVALKVLLPWAEQNADSIRRLTEEFKTIAGLRHPNIVKIHIFDQDHGRWYFSMQLFEGGTVADQLERYKADPRSAARLVEKVARAIHHAHRGNKRVLHLDLKPKNILLDADEPHISDFGLSIRLETLDRSVSSAPSGEPVGTPEYMSPEMASGMLRAISPACDMPPEMASGILRAISPACDIYGLGAILYTMLTGKPPFHGRTPRETLELVVAGKLAPPSKLNPKVDRLLEAICLRCLRKEPEHRYGSADALANDLRRWLNLEPPVGVEVSNFERFWLWTRRYPDGAALSTVAVVLLIATTARAVWVARAREAQLVRAVGQSNLFEAKHVASSILWELKILSGPVERESKSPDVRELLKPVDSKGLEKYAKKTLVKCKNENIRLQAWYVLDGKGKLLAASGDPATEHLVKEIIGHCYDWREYFSGALRHHEALSYPETADKSWVHISRVFVADSDHKPKFAFSAPVSADPDHGGRLLGVVVATTTTAADLGWHHLDDGGRTLVLVGRREPIPRPGASSLCGALPTDRPPSPLTAQLPELPILFHPGYPHQGFKPIGMPRERIRAVLRPGPDKECPCDEFRLHDLPQSTDPTGVVVDDYRDPLGDPLPLGGKDDPKFKGRWLAAFARVGGTGLVVGVQQKYDEAIPPGLTLALDSFLGVGSLALIVIVGYTVRRVAGWRDHRGASTVEN